MQDIGSLQQQLVSSCILPVGRRACFTADMTTMQYTIIHAAMIVADAVVQFFTCAALSSTQEFSSEDKKVCMRCRQQCRQQHGRGQQLQQQWVGEQQ